MKTFVRLSFVIALAVGFMLPPVASALPKDDIYTLYFNCAMEEVGLHWITCGGGIVTDGQQSGYFRYREWTPCDTGTWHYQWYRWNGTGWTAISGQPTAEC